MAHEPWRDDLVMDHLDLVGRVVDGVAAAYPRHVDRDDLRSAGALGLVDAASRYDPGTGVPFARFARSRIRGAVIDSTRARDWAPRRVRRELRRLHEVADHFVSTHARTPAHDELASALDTSRESVEQLLAAELKSTILWLDRPAGDDPEAPSFAHLVPAGDEAAQPAESLERREMAGTIMTAIACLPDTQRVVVERSYLRGDRLHEIAAALGVTVTRVSQIRREALAAIRAYLHEAFEAVPAVDDAAPGHRARAAFVTAMSTGSDWRARLDAAATANESMLACV